MNINECSKQIEEWIRVTLLLPGGEVADHCHDVRKNFALPGGLTVDFLTCRHQEPAAPGAPHLFTVHLWSCVEGAVTTQTIRDMGLSLLLFRAGYAQLLEEAQCRGWQRRHRINVRGNIIGARFERNDLIDTLSAGNGELVFWTLAVEEGKVLIEPYYVDAFVEEGGSLIEKALDHLAWDQGQPEPGASESQLLVALDLANSRLGERL